jgi:hypothetical protein
VCVEWVGGPGRYLSYISKYYAESYKYK